MVYFEIYNKMRKIIEYLKRPELVIRFQEYFGVKYLPSANDNLKSDLKSKFTSDSETCSNSSTYDCNRSPTINRKKSKSVDEICDDCLQKGQGYVIQKKFWYYLFLIGTELGDEIFYATFIPFWFWNIDGAVGRRVIFLWSIVMYIGQSLKDIIRWPRPGPPVIRLQEKWGQEYGMPSTHAMVGLSIPFSVYIFTIKRYQYSSVIGFITSTIWCTVICLSRIYLGMHSVLDVVVGLLLTFTLMVFLVPLVDYLDLIILSSKYSPIVILFISILLIVFYPKSDKWTPTRGDTTMTVSVCVGIQIGAWLLYQFGEMIPASTPPPYKIIWPNYQMLGLLLLRTVFGLCCIVATRAIGKLISYSVVCAILGKNKNEIKTSENSLENTNKTIVELSYKFFTYGLIGFNTQYLLPRFFKLLEIGRPDFYTEI